MTRNKLMFRDDLRRLLEAATPINRGLEKRFRDWLTECHAELDKRIRFEKMQTPAEQVSEIGDQRRLKKKHQECDVDKMGRAACRYCV